MAWLNTRQNAVKYEINYTKFTGKNVNILFKGRFQVSVFQNIYMDFLTDFMEGVRDFRVVGDPLGVIYGRRKSRQVRIPITRTHKSLKVACVCNVSFEQHRIYVLANTGCKLAKSILV